MFRSNLDNSVYIYVCSLLIGLVGFIRQLAYRQHSIDYVMDGCTTSY